MEDKFKAKGITKWVIFLCSCIIFLCYGIKKNNNKYKVLTEIVTPAENAKYLINTPGCSIPNYSKTLRRAPLNNLKEDCKRRFIFIKKISDTKIQFIFSSANDFKNIVHNSVPYTCHYKYALRSTNLGHQDSKLTYTENKVFKNGTITSLEHEVITVRCSLNQSPKKSIYEDSYMLVKKKEKPFISSGPKWNVLLIGMDTMSRARVYQTMPKVVKYLRHENWLDLRAYQKVGLNTFPNLMAGLGGLSSSLSNKLLNKTIEFSKHFIWNQYCDSGFATAYGEDFLDSPDTFARFRYAVPPTDHYMRPLFLLGEKLKGRHLCAGHLPSAEHILNYAADFTDSYKENNYFGLFWINSYSHHLNQDPALFDDKIKYFFMNLKKNGLLNNTFVIFYSDHGQRFGDIKLKAESFYDERLPMFFMRMPDLFIHDYPEEAQIAITNQYRLVTTYDFYLTLWAILTKSVPNLDKKSLDFCPSCSSIFELKPLTRTCADAGADAMPWCACCHLEKVNKDTAIADSLVKIVTDAINNKTSTIKTVKCTECTPMSLYKLLRIHKCFDEGSNMTRYVVAFSMNPYALWFEAIIAEENMNVIAMDTIGPWNAHSSCAINVSNRAYCVCRPTKHCNRKG